MATRRGGITVRIDGIARLRDQLEDVAADILKGLAKAVKASAEAVRDDTAAAVRVNTGRLRDTVDIRYESDGLIAHVGWFDPDSFYATFHEHGTRKIPARPALGPATEAERGRMRGRIGDEVRRALR